MAQGQRRCHASCPRYEKDLRKRTQAKNTHPRRTHMFSANSSWLSNFARGRSSGSAIGALLRLPGRCPVTHMEQNSRLTATSSRRICTCFPFHPSAALPPRTPWTLCSLVDIITHLPPAVKTEQRRNFTKTLYKLGKSGYHIQVYCKTRMRQDAAAANAQRAGEGCNSGREARPEITCPAAAPKKK